MRLTKTKNPRTGKTETRAHVFKHDNPDFVENDDSGENSTDDEPTPVGLSLNDNEND